MKNEKIVGNRGVLRTLLNDVSKTFDWTPHDPINVKLEAYGFHVETFDFIHSYLSNRKNELTLSCIIL